MTKPTQGGKRANAGRKAKYDDETTTFSFRCPKNKLNEVKKVISDKLKEYQQ